jgi:hypothetical protein
MFITKVVLQVWNWSEVNPERDAARCDEGASGDHYYGASTLACEEDEEGSLAEILAESFNLQRGVSLHVLCLPGVSIAFEWTAVHALALALLHCNLVFASLVI